MRVLLDTSYLYDVMEAPGKFLGPERRFLAAREVRIHVSAVSIWEMRLKHTARHLFRGAQEPFRSERRIRRPRRSGRDVPADDDHPCGTDG